MKVETIKTEESLELRLNFLKQQGIKVDQIVKKSDEDTSNRHIWIYLMEAVDFSPQRMSQ